MATQARNGPCPCGSGVKYKKCCQPKQPPVTDRRRIVDQRGQTMIASRGGEGPAAQVMRFAAPLLEAAGDDYQRTQRAMTLAMTFWNLALLEPDKQEELLAGFLRDTGPTVPRKCLRTTRITPVASSRPACWWIGGRARFQQDFYGTYY